VLELALTCCGLSVALSLISGHGLINGLLAGAITTLVLGSTAL